MVKTFDTPRIVTAVTTVPFGEDRKDLDRSPLEIDRLLSGNFWRELRTFLAVAKSRSYAKAGEMLQMSAPTVSRDIKRLQSAFGSQLVVANYAGAMLTPKGRALAMHLAELDYRLFSLSNNLKQEESQVAGRVSVSVTSGLGVAFVAPAVNRLTSSHPQIQVDLKEQVSFIHLEKNQTDIMLGMTPIQRPDVVCERAGILHLIPVASRGYVAQNGVPTRQNADHHRFIQCNYYVSKGPFWKNWNSLVDGNHSHFCDNSLTYFSLVKSGAGIGLLGNYVLIEPGFVPIELGVHIALPLYVLALRDRLQSKPAKVVFDWCKEIFLDNPLFGSDLVLSPGASAPEEDFRRFFNLIA